ncbi:MAG: hypothetical protein M3Z09_15155 [Acidobacteriota bacterium]|nr:hypothetical protein [Acidobacteriota bacterium]
MLVLLDHGTPRRVASYLTAHTVTKAIEKGWDRLTNGALLAAAEEAGFDVLVTTDKNMRYQQTLRYEKLRLSFSASSNGPNFAHTRSALPRP